MGAALSPPHHDLVVFRDHLVDGGMQIGRGRQPEIDGHLFELLAVDLVLAATTVNILRSQYFIEYVKVTLVDRLV